MILSDQFLEAKILLVDGWEKYKMLNNAVLVNDGKVVSFCQYNPFAGNEFVRDPLFYCHNITETSVDKCLKSIHNFINMRTRNLQKYPMRVRSL